MSNGDQTNLVTNQQPLGQTTQPTKQPASMYELFGSMTPEQTLQLKSGVIRHKQQKEIIRNDANRRRRAAFQKHGDHLFMDGHHKHQF